MRALVDLDGDEGALARAATLGDVREQIVLSDGERLADPVVLRALTGLRGVRARVNIASLDPTRSPRLGERLRGLARAAQFLPIDVVLPVAEGLGPAAARLVGLAHAVPKLSRFLLEPVPDAPLEARAPDELQREVDEALAAGRASGITTLLDDQCRVDTELLSLRAGLKPVIRLSSSADEGAFIARYRALGLAACAADGLFADDEGHHTRKLRLVYVAPTQEAADHAAAVERKTFTKAADVAQRAAEYRALGEALGYPACCVAAYAQRVVLEPSVHGSFVAEAHVCALGAYTPRPHWELNHHLMETGDAVVPFAPCTYDCPVALKLARAIFAQVTREAPLAARRIQRRLAVALAVDSAGARAIVELENDTIRAARPRRTPRGAFVHEADLALERRLTGQPLARAFREGDDQRVLLRFDLS